jgi:RecA/RadA recombinase
LDALLRDLGPRVQRGGAPEEATQRLPTGLPDIDALLERGFPRGRLSEIAGPASSGRTSLALALLAQTTGAGEVAALVDGADAFDPASARAAGTQLERVLWVRAPGTNEALRSTERLLEAHGFALVLLDLAVANLRMAPATAPRLARTAASTGAALVVVTAQRAMGTAAEVAIELAPAKPQFSGTPALLEGLEIEALLVRHRSAPAQRCVTVRLRSSQAA